MKELSIPTPPIVLLLRPFQRFAETAAAGGILLLACTLAALVWANSPWAESYVRLWQTPLIFGAGGFVLSKPLLLWINDLLMTIFFFVIGLEIKREVLAGELATPKQAALPIAAAIGGMAIPAAIYLSLNAGGEGAAGWGIPMATDIAFALGVMALLGDRVPLSLKIFLTALAIVDDIGAVLVIALFYTAEIVWASLLLGFGFLALMFLANWAGVRQPLIYLLLGAGLWLAFLKSGVHSTVAGVLSAMAIPSTARINAAGFVGKGRALLDEFARGGASPDGNLINEEQQSAVVALEDACEKVQTPLQRLEHALHPWVTFAIMPIFALANAGVVLGGDLMSALMDSVSLGVIAGLIVGKQIGVTLFAWLAVKTGLATMPNDLSWRQIYGASCLAGIGFTMSLFVAGLAFGESSFLFFSKLGILLASLFSGVLGWLILHRVGNPPFRRQTVEP